MKSFDHGSKRNGYIYPVLKHLAQCLSVVTIIAVLCSCQTTDEPLNTTLNKPKAEAPPPVAAESEQEAVALTPVITETAPKPNDAITGKWYGYWETPWGQVSEVLIDIAHIDNNRYRINVYESTEEYAPIIAEIDSTLSVQKNTLIFDSGEVIHEGKGVIANGLLKGAFQGSENGTFVLHTINKKPDINLAGKWQGQWQDQWGQQEAVSINVTAAGDGGYQFAAVESFEPGAMTLFTLNGKIEDCGQISFAGQTEIWTGDGKGYTDNQTWSGTFEGDENGYYMLRRVTP